MKKVMSLWDKLKVCKYWLFGGHGDALIETCHYCKSTHMDKVFGYDDNDDYIAVYKCRNCGATCRTKERWWK